MLDFGKNLETVYSTTVYLLEYRHAGWGPEIVVCLRHSDLLEGYVRRATSVSYSTSYSMPCFACARGVDDLKSLLKCCLPGDRYARL